MRTDNHTYVFLLTLTSDLSINNKQTMIHSVWLSNRDNQPWLHPSDKNVKHQIPSGTDSRMTRFEWHTLGLPTVTCVQYRWIPGGHWTPIVLQTNTVWEDHYRRPTQGWQRSHNFKSFEGPVLNCRDGTTQRGHYWSELVIDEIRNIWFFPKFSF